MLITIGAQRVKEKFSYEFAFTDALTVSITMLLCSIIATQQ